MDSLTIREMVEQVDAGQIRIPAFQRGFVWEPERVAHFMDSIYKNYPFGAVLFWRASEQLKVERKLGPFDLPKPKADYPIDYVLDGQQRVTSCYAVFQTAHELKDAEGWKDVFFDFSLAHDAQETQFFALSPAEVDPSKHFPLRVLFDTTGYRKATKELDDAEAERIDQMQSRFKEARLPIQIFKTEDKGTVAVIFERINRQGVPLDTLQLLSAWTWSEDFQLQVQFGELVDELQSKGFATGGFDENLLLRCASAVLVTDPRPEAIVKIPGEQVRRQFDEVVNGLLGALDFLQMNLGIRRIDNLPFQTILVPLSVFFAVPDNKHIVVNEQQRAKLLRWFWRVCFTRRYSSGVIRHLDDDIKAMLQLKGGQQSNLGTFDADIEGIAPMLADKFGIASVNTKTFILLLAQQSPRSFISGLPLDLNEKLKEYNRAEFHHMMPRAFVRAKYGEGARQARDAESLVNFCFLSRSENSALGGDAPSKYREKMPQEVAPILQGAVCPESLFTDDLGQFWAERFEMLSSVIGKLIK